MGDISNEYPGFDGKVVIVTGGASGVGRATAVLLAKAGATVVIADTDVAAANAVGESIGGAATVVETDLRSLASIQALVDDTVARHGRIDGLANVAAVYNSTPFIDVSSDNWQTIDDVNHRAVFFLSQAVARAVIAAGGTASIVNVASGAAFRPVGGQSAYSGTKGGVVSLSRTMAQELAGHDIRVNVVAPGHVASETIVSRMTDEQRESVAAGLVGKRWMEPEEVAEAVVFFLGEESRGMTGSCLNVNLGNFMPH